MLNNYTATVSSNAIARKAGFVYLIYVREIKALYVGQTYSMYGALGRFSQHLSETNSNTLRQRVCAIYGYDEYEFAEVLINAVQLSSIKSFNQSSSEYREAVESIVNNKIITFASNNKSGFVISRTRSNPYIKEGYVVEEANDVISIFEAWLLQVV